MFPAPQCPTGCAWERLWGRHMQSRNKACPLSLSWWWRTGQGESGHFRPGESQAQCSGGPFLWFPTGRWGLPTGGLQSEPCSADQPTCCHSPAACPSPFGSWRHDVRLPSAPTHTPLVLSRRGRESGERQTEWQTQLTSFPAGLVPGLRSSRKASKLPRTASC